MSEFLIVDDSKHIQSLLKALLEVKNHNVVLADNGADALDKARHNPPDMVVSDVIMPVMDGFTLCREWKNDNLLKNIPFVFYTSAHSNEKDEEDALKMADKLIHKSLEPEAFIKVMLDLIHNAEHIKAMIRNPELEEEESYKLYNDRLVEKLEEKTLELELEIAGRKKTEQDLKLSRIELELQNEELIREHTKLKNSENRYRCITDVITDYVYTVYLEAGRPVETIHRANCFAVTGYTGGEFSADPYLWISIVPEEDREPVLQQTEDVLAGLFPQSIQYRIVRKEGEIHWVESMMVPNYDFNGNLISYDGLIRDITTRKRLEEQVVHAQKMDSIGTLAGGVAHDFNNILTAIIGFSSILSRKISKNNPFRFYVDQIQLAAESAANLTGSLLAFGRKQKINPMPLNFNMLIKKIEKLLSRIIREDIDFSTIQLDNDLNVMADFGQMQQVLMNLVTNARDAMPDGGLLVLTSESFRIDNEFVKSRGFGKPGLYALIAVSDTGVGIDEMSKEKIFEPFFTSKETDKGTGLGLSIVYGIIKQHKGFIDLDSVPGKGTTVKLYLPIIEVRETESIKQLEDIVPRGGRETILLVEDNTMTRQFLLSVLTEFRYRVITAGDGEEALKKFRERKNKIQFIITDVIMPKKSGKELYAEIKKIRPDVKVLFLSGYSNEVLKNEEAFLKKTNFLPKPVKSYKLLKKIREILDGE